MPAAQGPPPSSAFPVGFVGAAESKDELVRNPRGIPYATLLGRRGGSAMAAAVRQRPVERPRMTKWLTIIGMGEDGYEGLSARAKLALQSADVIVGSERLLGFLPALEGRAPWNGRSPSPPSSSKSSRCAAATP